MGRNEGVRMLSFLASIIVNCICIEVVIVRSRNLVEASVFNRTANPSETPRQPMNNVTNNLGNSSNNGYNWTSTASFQGCDNKILKTFGISRTNVDITVTCNAATGTSNDGNLDLTDRKITTEIAGVKVTRKAMTATSGDVTGHKNTTTIGNIKAAPLATTAASSNATGNKNTTTTVEVATATNAASAMKTTIVTNYRSGRIGSSHHMCDGSSICYSSFGLNNMTEKASGTRDTNKLSANNNSRGLDIYPKSVLQVQGCHPRASIEVNQSVGQGDAQEQMEESGVAAGMLSLIRSTVQGTYTGAKRRVETFQPAAAFPTAKPSTSTHPCPNLCFPNKDPHATLNTKLSISTQQIVN